MSIFYKYVKSFLKFFLRIYIKEKNTHFRRVIDQTIYSVLSQNKKFFYKENFLKKKRRTGFWSETLMRARDREIFIVHPHETISHGIYVNGQFDFDKIIYAIKIIKKKNLLLDVGANIGSISIPSLKRCLFNKVIAIEPEQESFKLLNINVLINNLQSKATIYNLALAKTKTKNFSKLLPDSRFNRGNNILVSDNYINKFNRIKLNKLNKKKLQVVDTDILDNYTFGLNKNNSLIKIDTQGSTLSILEGGKKTLKKKIALLIEFDENEIIYSKEIFLILSKYYDFFYDLKNNKVIKLELNFANFEKILNFYKKKKTYTDLLIV